METSAKALHSAIEAGSMHDVNVLLESVDVIERQKLLQQRIDGSNPIERAFAHSEIDIGLVLAESIIPSSIRLSIQQYATKKILPHQWRRVFMTFKHYFSLLKNGRRISSKELAAKMAFLKPFCPQINLSDINDREAFVRTALLLGVKYNPQQLCNWILWEEENLLKWQKENLVDWLIENGFLLTELQPLFIEDYGKAIKKGFYEHLQIFMSRFPNWVKTTNPEGRTVLNCISPGRMKLMNRYMGDIKQQFGAEKLIELLVQRFNDYSRRITCFDIYSEFHGNHIKFRKEIVMAMMECAKTGEANHIIGNSLHGSFSMLIYHTLPQYRSHPKAISASNGALYAINKELDGKSAENRLGSREEFPIYNLPADLIYVIAWLINPMDLFNLLTANKLLATFLHRSKNEKFWQSYYDANFLRDFGPKMISCKAKTVQNAKSTHNWRRDRYRQIKLEQMAPVIMDENWLILRSKEKDRHIVWNCHSQEQRQVPNYTSDMPVALMTDYATNELPSYISYQYSTQKYSLRRGSEYFSLKILLNPLVENPLRSIFPIDHRILVHGSIYDIETEQVVAQSSQAHKGYATVYNPYSKTFLVHHNRQLEMCDLNGEAIKTYKLAQMYNIGESQQIVLVNEYEVCFANSMHYFDLRTGRAYRPWTKDSLLDVAAVSPQRVLYCDRQVDIVVSWHLSSISWEFASMTEVVPQCLNSRYISANNENGDTIIIDYCQM